VSAALIALCLVLGVAIIKREARYQGSLTGGEARGSPAPGATPAEEQQAPADDRVDHRVRGRRRGDCPGNSTWRRSRRRGRQNTDSITSFLGTVQLYTSMIGRHQVWLTSKIQRYLGIGRC
jgi:hypothetical protein